MNFKEYLIESYVGSPDQARPDPSFQGTSQDFTGFSLADGGKTPQLVHSFPKNTKEKKKKRKKLRKNDF